MVKGQGKKDILHQNEYTEIFKDVFNKNYITHYNNLKKKSNQSLSVEYRRKIRNLSGYSTGRSKYAPQQKYNFLMTTSIKGRGYFFKSEINYPGIIEFIFTTFLSIENKSIYIKDYISEPIINLLDDYFFLNFKEIELPNLYELLEGFVLGYGKEYMIRMIKNQDLRKIENDTMVNNQLSLDSYFIYRLFKSGSLFYFLGKIENKQTDIMQTILYYKEKK